MLSLLSEKHKILGGRKKFKVFWSCLVLCWSLGHWLERNQRIFGDKAGADEEDLWDMIKSWRLELFGCQ